MANHRRGSVWLRKILTIIVQILLWQKFR